MNIPFEILLPYIGLAITLIASVTLFLTLKIEIRRDQARHARALEKQKADHSALSKELQTIRLEILSIPGLAYQRGTDVDAPLGRRTQIVRMYQAGMEPSQIAAVLGAPIREIELAIKTHHLKEGAVALAKQ